MKKKFLNALVGVIVIFLILISVKYLSGGNPFSSNPDIISPENANVPAQKGKPDEASKNLVKILKKYTGEELDPKNIVSKGKKIIEGKFSYVVDSWSVKKENPGYQFSDEYVSKFKELGAELDSGGNITNDCSYVVVNMEVGNLKEKEVMEYVWGYIHLRIPGQSLSSMSSSPSFLGEKVPREDRRDFFKETFQPKQIKKMSLIFVVKDALMKDKQLYLEINSSGTATVNPDYDVRRFIVLN